MDKIVPLDPDHLEQAALVLARAFVTFLDEIFPLIPSSVPDVSQSGPPELPGLIRASCWIAFP